MYPIAPEYDWQENQSRLTTVFRLILAIPLFIVVYVWGLLLCITLLASWFAILITGRYPVGLYSFNAGVLRYFTRLYGYVYILTDRYPPFGLAEAGDYPVRVTIGPAQESYSRVTVFLRLLLAIPALLGAAIAGLVAEALAIANWFVVVFTGKLPKGLHDVTAAALAYSVRVNGYLFLFTDAYPPLVDVSVPPGRHVAGEAPEGLSSPERPSS